MTFTLATVQDMGRSARRFIQIYHDDGPRSTEEAISCGAAFQQDVGWEERSGLPIFDFRMPIFECRFSIEIESRFALPLIQSKAITTRPVFSLRHRH
jgi:hypothetical protein